MKFRNGWHLSHKDGFEDDVVMVINDYVYLETDEDDPDTIEGHLETGCKLIPVLVISEFEYSLYRDILLATTAQYCAFLSGQVEKFEDDFADKESLEKTRDLLNEAEEALVWLRNVALATGQHIFHTGVKRDN